MPPLVRLVFTVIGHSLVTTVQDTRWSVRVHRTILGTGAHVRCEGKGRKERCTPLTKSTVIVLTAWIRDQGEDGARILFPSARGGRLSADAVQHLVAKYAA